MKYARYSILYPPRPEHAIPPAGVGRLEGTHFAQVKLNGTCSIITVDPEGELYFHNRHGEKHKAWKPDLSKLGAFSKLKGWHVFVAELMHSKVEGMRDINYVHDVIVANGRYMTGKSALARQDVLASLFPNTKDEGDISHTVIDRHTWLARNHMQGFKELYDALDRPEYEGLVLKDRETGLKLPMREKSNAGQQVKARKTHKNYSF